MGRPRKAVLASKEKPSKKSCLGQADFEKPLLSRDDACYQFICSYQRYPVWVKVLKLRYWLDFGDREDSGYLVKWRDTKNRAKVAIQHLTRVVSCNEEDDSKVNLFTLNLYNLKRKIMIQGSHKDVWVKNEFQLLKKLVDAYSEDENLSDIYFLVTGTKIEVQNEELVPSDNEEEEEMQQPEDSDDDYEVDKEILVIDTPKSKLKSPIRKKRSPAKQIAELSKQRSKVMSKSKEKATSSLNLPVDTELQNIELRMRNLEEITSVIDNTIASQVVNIMEHESEIEKLISCKIDEQLRDLKEQHKNGISILSKKLTEIQEQFEKELAALKTDTEKVKTRIINVNDRCTKLEKTVKENKTTIEEKNDSIAHHIKSTLITKEEVSVKFNLIEKSLQDVEGKLQNELQSLKDDLMSVDISDYTPTTSEKVSSNNISITLDSPDKVTSDQHVKMPMQTKFESPPPVTERYHFQRRQAKPVDFVFLMDSNRRFLEIESAFPEREVGTVPTGSIEKAQSIIDNPRFSDIKALCIHTGVNDLESDTHYSNSIAKSLIEVAKSASRRFPNTKVFISEITPRRDEYNLKGIEVNSILKEEA